MNYLSVENISKSYSEITLFEDLTFGISKGQKVALVAKNGAGKSTLFKLLTNQEAPDSGRIVYNNDIKIGYLAQDSLMDESKTILENIFDASNEVTDAIRFYEKAVLENNEENLHKAYGLMDQFDAWDYESKAKQILGKLDITDLDKDVSKLSGGQKRRVALAKVLIEEPDFLLLDEPTNHLDLDMIEWLEEYFVKTSMTLLMITHDRYFLEVVCDEILELNNKQLYKYKGNFSYYLEKKSEREDLEQASKDKAQNLMRRELKWIRTQPKARGTKSKYRKEEFVGLKERATVDLTKDQMTLEINMERLGGKIVEMHRVQKAYGDIKILNKFDYTFKTRERVGFVGKNGVGKTTFLNLITGKDQPDAGKIVIGDTVKFGYYTQKGMNFNEDMKVIDAVREIADIIPLKSGKKITAEQMLERFLFPRSTQRNFIYKLSGGEKKRLYLLTVLMKNPNFLILDEPTNDLDIFTLSVLEDYLLQFPGVLMVVSHDRYFIDKLIDHILVFEGQGKVRDFPGNYSQLREAQIKEKKAAKKAAPDKPKPTKDRSNEPKTKLSFNEKYEFDQLEKEIPELEAKKKVMEEKLNSGEITDHKEMMKLANELGDLIADLDKKSDRWMELAEYL